MKLLKGANGTARMEAAERLKDLLSVLQRKTQELLRNLQDCRRKKNLFDRNVNSDLQRRTQELECSCGSHICFRHFDY
ncbi:hypothetical protein PHAVU_002G272900 [Phaseolus vulgaris]|uniref:Uncharacterized protein n=1 Tax=Phaseolus vulgaris TaxID=3885 RepID=V7CR65_PHAVU|nr:hypothetical protein PHAVU_002G272900g [Phaseolus vulgaris]ESW31843.1 hypothetical protein PHAVU_002G272900g [Phaseolus vulgaris]